MRGQDIGITSLQLTAFTPNGQMLAAFENGEVKLWKSFVPEERLKRIRDQMEEEKKTRKQKQKVLDLAEIGIAKFDIHDQFDMFENPHNLTQEMNSDDIQLKTLYGVSFSN